MTTMKALLRTMLIVSLLWMIALAVQNWPQSPPEQVPAQPMQKMVDGRADFDIHDRLRPVQFD